jgi:hypothetical protein
MDPDPDSDPDADLDPSIFIIDVQDANKKLIFVKKFFCLDPGSNQLEPLRISVH